MSVEVVKENLRKALDFLECSMVFDQTPQGYEYWDCVRNNMKALLASPEPRKPVEAWAGGRTVGNVH